MSQRDLLQRLLQFTDQYNISQHDLRRLPAKALVLSLKYVDRRALYQQLFPDEFADWELLEQHSLGTARGIGDAETWLNILGLFKWDLQGSSGEIEAQHKPLALVRDGLKANGLDGGWDMACRALILQLLRGIQCAYATERLTARALSRDTRQATMQFLAGLLDAKHLPEEYHRTLAFVLSPDRMGTVDLTQALADLRAQQETRSLNLRQKSMQLVALRPRLRDKLKTSLLTEQRKERVDSMAGTWDSFQGFCQKHRFPNTLSDRVKRQLYFLAAQTRWAWGEHVPALLDNEEMARGVCEHPVLQPDCEVLNWVIERLSMDGRRPFKEMMAFKSRCFNSFPVVHVQQLTLTQILRLYVAAYQDARVWKEVWKEQIGVISPQIVRDCEEFVAGTPFASECVVGALLGN